MKKVMIIGSGLLPIHLKHCIDIVIEHEKKEHIKKLNMSFQSVVIAVNNTTDAINEFVESIKQAKFDQSFEPEPSKFMSKPKYNFKKR